MFSQMLSVRGGCVQEWGSLLVGLFGGLCLGGFPLFGGSLSTGSLSGGVLCPRGASVQGGPLSKGRGALSRKDSRGDSPVQ